MRASTPKAWVLRIPAAPERAQELAVQLGISHTFATLLANRGFSSSVDVQDFLEPNLDRLTQRPEQFALYPLSRVASLDQRRFFIRLNRLFFTELPTRVQDEFHYHADIVSRLLDRELGVFGLYIGKYNVKILPDLAGQRLTLLVTDLAVYLDRLGWDGHGRYKGDSAG